MSQWMDKEELDLQRECSKFVQQEVVYCVSVLISQLGRRLHDDEWADEWIELVTPADENCGCDMSEEDIKEAQDNDEELEPCGSCVREIFEHWIVSGWLANSLRERGEVVVDFMNMDVWARTTTGQSIALDGVIRDIITERIQERKEREVKYG